MVGIFQRLIGKQFVLWDRSRFPLSSIQSTNHHAVALRARRHTVDSNFLILGHKIEFMDRRLVRLTPPIALLELSWLLKVTRGADDIQHRNPAVADGRLE